MPGLFFDSGRGILPLHVLLTGPDGKRYAKRDQSVTLRHLRESGHTPDDIRALIEAHIARGDIMEADRY